jgi:hypothetical protein
MDQLGRRGGRGARVIVLLREHRFEAESRRVPRNRSAMDAAADNQRVERFHGHRVTVLKSSIADPSAGRVKIAFVGQPFEFGVIATFRA